MSSEIIKKDKRLFLFRAIEFGLAGGLIKPAAQKRLQKQGAALSFGFAKKYYRVVYEAYLRQASFCVLGVINLGLEAAAKGDLTQAAGLIANEGYVTLFRQGWSRILKLAHLIKMAEDREDRFQRILEKDLAEWLSAEPDRPWQGVAEFVTSVRKYGTLAQMHLADESEGD